MYVPPSKYLIPLLSLIGNEYQFSLRYSNHKSSRNSESRWNYFPVLYANSKCNDCSHNQTVMIITYFLGKASYLFFYLIVSNYSGDVNLWMLIFGRPTI